MDAAKVDMLLEYAAASAAQADDPVGRRLGAIHLLKYVYLADLAHAEKYGTTFTGAPWRFHHYGPWNYAVFSRIAIVVAQLGAHEFAWSSSRYEGDAVRWSLDPESADDLLRDLDRKLPVAVTLAVRRAVKEFGADTPSLLHHVYTTSPMLHAAPEEDLNFAIAKPAPNPGPNELADTPDEPTAKELKRRKEATLRLKERFRAAVAAGNSQRATKVPDIRPIYDEIFVEGARQIEALAGTSPEGLAGDASVSEDVWKSEFRKRGRLP